MNTNHCTEAIVPGRTCQAGEGGAVMKLTKSQQRILDTVAANRIVTFKAVMRRPIEALVRAGLVSSRLEVRVDALRGRHTLVYVVVLR